MSSPRVPSAKNCRPMLCNSGRNDKEICSNSVMVILLIIQTKGQNVKVKKGKKKSPLPSWGWALYLLLLFRSLVDEVHELIELRRDDNLSATVALLAHFRIVSGNGVELTTTTSGQTLRVDAIMVLQVLHHR